MKKGAEIRDIITLLIMYIFTPQIILVLMTNNDFGAGKIIFLGTIQGLLIGIVILMTGVFVDKIINLKGRYYGERKN